MKTVIMTFLLALMPAAAAYAMGHSRLTSLHESTAFSCTWQAFLKTVVRIIVNIFELVTLPGVL